MRKVLTALVAGGLLVGAAFAASVIGDAGTASAQEITEEGAEIDRPRRPGILDAALDELIAEGMINSDQAQAIKEKVAAKVEEFKAEHPNAGHPFRRGARFGFHLAQLLDDGVITADKIAELPDDHPLKDPDGPAAEYLDDGELSLEELRQLRQEIKEQRATAKQDTETTSA